MYILFFAANSIMERSPQSFSSINANDSGDTHMDQNKKDSTKNQDNLITLNPFLN